MPPLARRRAVAKKDISNMSKNIEKISSFRLPDDNDTPERWNEFITAELTPVKQSEIDQVKRAIKLYRDASYNMKETFNKQSKLKTQDDWDAFQRNLIRLMCENVHILANLEVRQKRQIKIKEILSKLEWH